MNDARPVASGLPDTRARERSPAGAATVSVAALGAVSASHLLNDLVQSLIPAVYPLFKESFHLDYAQIGLITLAFQLATSVFQPFVGLYSDRYPSPFAATAAMGGALVGILVLATASSFSMLLLGAAIVGLGASVFHPEASRIARMASGGRYGLAESVFQVGGHAGTALGPLLAAFIVVPFGQASLAWFCLAILLAIVILFNLGRWYRRHLDRSAGAHRSDAAAPVLPRKIVALSLTVLVALVFSKLFYLTSMTSYYTLYLIQEFGLSIPSAQIDLFVFLSAVAIGTFIGGPIGDKIGRKYVIWCSILGVLPFTLLLPYANHFWTGLLSVVIGLILASAFPAIVVYARELLPNRVGLVGGLFYGAGAAIVALGAAALGKLADVTSIGFVFHVCSFLPAIGILTIFLPNLAVARTQ